MNTQERNHPPIADKADAPVGQRFRETLDRNTTMASPTDLDFQNSLDIIGQKYAGVRDAVIGTTKGYAKTTNEYVSRNPWMLMGITGGLAFFAGLILGRRR
jgi:hypothetical protein